MQIAKKDKKIYSYMATDETNLETTLCMSRLFTFMYPKPVLGNSKM